MWCITFHVVPKPATPEYEKSGGAYVDCWLLYAWEDGAEHLARYEVEKEWIIIGEQGRSWIDFKDFEPGDPDIEYFDQAMIDGGTFVYNLYPLKADDERDEDFEIENATSSDRRLLRNDN